MDDLKDIRKENRASLEQWLCNHGFPKFRANQVIHWIWEKGAVSFEEMSNIPSGLRALLLAHYRFKPVTIQAKEVSRDQTIKTLFKLYDENVVEGVLIPSGARITACISSQVGCSLNCKFCATGYMQRKRNLDSAEIVDQVRLLNTLAQENFGRNLSNIVYMGMGEPLLNYREVVESVRIISSDQGLGIAPRRITISTAGIEKMIYKLADENLGVHLALSLHSADNDRRSALMPINETNNLDLLKDALSYFYHKTRKRPTIEYSVINGVNDDDDHLEKLVAYVRQFPCKVNLIEYNPIPFADFRPTKGSGLDNFADKLAASGIIVNVRRSRGRDISAACGQLATKSL